MTHEEIIAMAREEGLSFVPDANSPLARIVRKAVAKEREACAQVCEANRTNPPQGKPDDVERGFNAAIRRCAAAIRARGQKEGA
jgi:hypothetical protein